MLSNVFEALVNIIYFRSLGFSAGVVSFGLQMNMEKKITKVNSL